MNEFVLGFECFCNWRVEKEMVEIEGGCKVGLNFEGNEEEKGELQLKW